MKQYEIYLASLIGFRNLKYFFLDILNGSWDRVWKMFSRKPLPFFSFILDPSVRFLEKCFCWLRESLLPLSLDVEVNLVLLIDMEETGAGELASLWLVNTPHLALWLADDWRISPGDHSSFSLHHHLSAPLNSCQPSLKLYLYEKSKISISNNPVKVSELAYFWKLILKKHHQSLLHQMECIYLLVKCKSEDERN